jgi:hypothetical protein
MITTSSNYIDLNFTKKNGPMLFSIYLASLITFSSVIHAEDSSQNVKIDVHRTGDNVQMGWLAEGFTYVKKENDGIVFQLKSTTLGDPMNKLLEVGARAPHRYKSNKKNLICFIYSWR